jgi:hypothetical protein
MLVPSSSIAFRRPSSIAAVTSGIWLGIQSPGGRRSSAVMLARACPWAALP